MANKYKAIFLVNQRISCSYPEQCGHNQMRSCKFKVHASTQQLTTFNLQLKTHISTRNHFQKTYKKEVFAGYHTGRSRKITTLIYRTD